MKMELKRLSEYHAEGYHFKCIRRKGDVGVFEQLRNGVAVAYEVIIIRKNSNGEYPPTTEEWGKYGWTFTGLPRALKEFEGLCSLRGLSE